MKIHDGDPYYYFPSQTMNIKFIRGEKYVFTSKDIYHNNKLRKNDFKYLEIYICYDFTNKINDPQPIYFIDSEDKKYKASPWDIGSFISLKEYRLKKLKQLGQYESE
jgi:hypothetical protein